MYTKNLRSYNYNVNIGTIIIRKINLRKILFLLLFLTICFTSKICFYNYFQYSKNGDVLVADFKTDINILSETADDLEIERTSNKYLEINQFGSEGKLVHVNEIKPDLLESLIKIVDIDNDGKISNEEIASLGIMRLKSDIFQKELKELQFNLKSSDHNLENYIIITSGKYAGTIFYNGPLKYIDNQHKRCFGL